MTAPPEPLMPLLIAAKPGAKPREFHVDEATGEQLMRDLVVALAGIRAAKAAVHAMTAPPAVPTPLTEDAPGVHPYERFGTYSPCAFEWEEDGDEWMCSLPPGGHGPQHEAWTTGGTAPVSVLAVTPPDDDTTAGELAADEVYVAARGGVPGAMGLGDNAAFWAAHPRAAAALANVPGTGLDDGPFERPRPTMADVLIAAAEMDSEMREPETDDDAPAGDGPCMTAGCGHGAGDHVQSRGTGERMFCVTCPCRRYLGLRRIVDVDGEIAVDGHDPGGVTYTNVNHLSCGCSFLGPLTWPAGKQARCDDHGPVTTVDGEPDEPMPDCTRPGCGHGERAHAADDEENADGPCLLGGCRCAAYLLPPVTVAAALAPVSFLRHDQQTLAGVKIGGTS